MSGPVADPILWRASTTRHDWNDGRYLRAWLEGAAKLGLAGPVTWRQRRIRGEHEPISLDGPAALLDDLPEPLPDEPPNAYVEAGGEEPHAWTVTLSISPFDEERRRLTNLNMAWLTFDAGWASSKARSRALIRAFMQAHAPGNTEYAFIHPFEHWKRFSDAAYHRPVTTGQQFRGVFWANFLGPGHIDQFDRDKLADLPAAQVKWVRDDGLFVLATPDVRHADEPAVEADLERLTERFRVARRAASRGSR